MKTTELAHRYWKEIVQKGDTIIDATLGNGHDTVFLAKLLDGTGSIFSYDIQIEALESAKKLFSEKLSSQQSKNITLHHLSHENLVEKEAKLIVYNLGYLPGGNKALTTKKETTLKSLYSAQNAIRKGGVISITCYPGHAEGALEEKEIMAWSRELPSQEWDVCYHQWLNRDQAPSLILIRQK